MKNLIKKLHTPILTIVIFLTLSFIAVAIDYPFLAGLSLFIAPLLAIYLNKKFTIKTGKYYSTILGIFLASFIFSGVIISNDPNTVNKQETVSVNKNEVIKTEEKNTTDEDKKIEEADKIDENCKRGRL